MARIVVKLRQNLQRISVIATLQVVLNHALVLPNELGIKQEFVNATVRRDQLKNCLAIKLQKVLIVLEEFPKLVDTLLVLNAGTVVKLLKNE